VHPDETEISLESDSDVHSEEENEILHHTAGLPTNEQQDEEVEKKQHQHERRRQQQEQQKSQKQLPRSASEWGLPSQSRSLDSVHNFAGGPHGMKVSEAPHINHTSSPLAVFNVIFCRSYQTAGGGDKYYHQYSHTLDQDTSPLADVCESEVILFLGIILQMRQNDYWLTVDQMYTPFYSNTMKHG
jgi:hypothetical protein